jgi:hypothetical protein
VSKPEVENEVITKEGRKEKEKEEEEKGLEKLIKIMLTTIFYKHM